VVSDDQPDAREGQVGGALGWRTERKRQFAKPPLDAIRLNIREVLTVYHPVRPCWSGQNPTISLEDDVAVTKRILAAQDGPTILVGHSYEER
jgi:hypothetical protein